MDPRNGSCPSKKERRRAGVAAAWQLPPTWDSPRSDFAFSICLVVVVVVVAAAAAAVAVIVLPLLLSLLPQHGYVRVGSRVTCVTYLKDVVFEPRLRKPCNSAATWLMSLAWHVLNPPHARNFYLTSEVTRDPIA